MPTNTYVALDKVTVGTATSSVSFTGINQGYTDLVLVASIQTQTNNDAVLLRFNSDTGSNYSYTALQGNGSSASSYRESNKSNGFRIGNGYPNSTSYGLSTVSIMNYGNSTTYKTAIARGNNAGTQTDAFVGLWRNTAAITSITIIPESLNTLLTGSTFSLYGIAAASVGAKATGGTISSDDQYWYHTFTSSGTFTPLQSLTADCLVVAGGGGGGGGNGGGAGGGAGGLRSLTSQSLSTTNYTITVGAGGAGGTERAYGSKGVDSTAFSVSASGGGQGGYFDGAVGTSGGSGGGGGSRGSAGSTSGGSGNAGSYSPVEGYAGGSGSYNPGYAAGGGGGAGGVGGNATTTTAGTGGIGINWLSAGTYYAGGGGGGSNSTGSAALGGLGGGGNGSRTTSAAGGTPGTIATGGGGGGGGDAGSGNAGGSGVVIVRYLKA